MDGSGCSIQVTQRFNGAYASAFTPCQIDVSHLLPNGDRVNRRLKTYQMDRRHSRFCLSGFSLMVTNLFIKLEVDRLFQSSSPNRHVPFTADVYECQINQLK